MLCDGQRARAVRSAHGTLGLCIPRCDPLRFFSPSQAVILVFFNTSLFFGGVFSLIIPAIVIASPQTCLHYTVCAMTY